MVSVMPTTNAYTLEYWISSFRGETNVVSDFVTKVLLSDGENAAIFMDQSLLSKYTIELEPHKVTVDLTDRERQFYAYNPRLFSNDLYGVPELWYLVLYANEIYSAMQFDMTRVKFYKTSVLNVLNTIRQLELGVKNDNDDEINRMIVNKTPSNASVLTSRII